MNEHLYRALQWADDREQNGTLERARGRFVEETLAEFRQAGAELEPEKKRRLAAVRERLAVATQTFKQNLLDAMNAFEKLVTDPALLSGLPDSAVDAARADARSRGMGTESDPVWRFTLQAPSVTPVLQYADREALRRELFQAQSDVAATGEFDNTALIGEILALRDELAALLGKANFADVVLERRMAHSGGKALAFVESLHDRVSGACARETAELEAFVASLRGGEPSPLEPWDASYYAEKLRQDRFDLDPEMLRPYFAIHNVIGGLFQLAETLYGIQVRERTGDEKPAVWHPEVQFFDVYDAQSGEHLGSFYADWHPRSSKRSGAWFNHLSTGRRDAVREPHLGVICANLSAPIDGRPALLTHREVRTVFHEFGHLLHHVLGDVPVRSLNGTNVAWDFVELPSKMMENWTWHPESLARFATHHETGESLPQSLATKMIRARNFRSATAFMRQLLLSKMDLELHVNHSNLVEHDIDELLDSLLADYRVPTPTRHRSLVRRFGHLFRNPVGYAAGYYSYKWSEVLEADAFTSFERAGVVSPTVGRRFREEVLSKGNSREPQDLLTAFLGRDPDPTALLVREGLI